MGCSGFFGDFFDRQHVIDTVTTLFKKRNSNRRLFLWIFLVAMFVYTFQRDEKSYTYLYTGMKFHWTVEQFSNFKVFQSTTYIIVLFCGMPVMTKLLKWRDTTIAMVGAFCYAMSRVFFVIADIPELFYVAAGISSVGPVSAPILRSMTSKVVSSSERGKVFAILSVCDNAVPLVSSVLYSQIYNVTVGKFAGIYMLTIVTQIILFILMLWVWWPKFLVIFIEHIANKMLNCRIVHLLLKGRQLAVDEIKGDSANANPVKNIENPNNISVVSGRLDEKK